MSGEAAGELSRRRYIISSLPRCGSTTLARVLSLHPELRCLLEPFHPKRYNGRFHAFVQDERTLLSALDAIWSKWPGLKHVWESSGWPFLESPSLNEPMLRIPGVRTIVLTRRNLLRRLVSNYLSRVTGTWMGPKEVFLQRLENTELKPLDPEVARAQIERDRSATEAYLAVAKSNGALVFVYEDIFLSGRTAQQQYEWFGDILEYLNAPMVDPETFELTWLPHFDRAKGQWASEEVYKKIPGIEDLERCVGNDETGWLFR